MSSQRITWTDWGDGNNDERYGDVGGLRLFIAHRRRGEKWRLDTSIPPFNRLGSFGSFAEIDTAAHARLEEFVAQLGARFS